MVNKIFKNLHPLRENLEFVPAYEFTCLKFTKVYKNIQMEYGQIRETDCLDRMHNLS